MHRRFVRVVNTREVLQLSTPCFQIHPFYISPLALFEWCVHKNFDEAFSAHSVSDVVPRCSIRTDCRADHCALVPDDLRRHKTNSTDVCIAIFFAEAEPARKMIANHVAVEQRNLPAKLL